MLLSVLVCFYCFPFSGKSIPRYLTKGIPWVARKMMMASSPTIEISKKDDKWTVKTSTLMSSSSNTFQLGEEYEETMMGGRSIKVK